jgi:hypothetical protein
MEFIIGFIFAFISIYAIKFILERNTTPETFNLQIIARQSRNFELIKPALPYLPETYEEKNSQAFAHLRSTQKRVIFTEDTAYWIDENVLYNADVINGEIDLESKKRVDTMNMDKVELDKMIFIVEKLTEGIANDGGNSSKSSLQ